MSLNCLNCLKSFESIRSLPVWHIAICFYLRRMKTIRFFFSLSLSLLVSASCQRENCLNSFTRTSVAASPFCSAYNKSSRCPITFQCAVWRGTNKTFKRMLLFHHRLDDNLIAIFRISSSVAATHSNFNNICRHRTPSKHRYNGQHLAIQ